VVRPGLCLPKMSKCLNGCGLSFLHNSHCCLFFLRHSLRSCLRSHVRENLALRHQNGLLQRPAAKRLKLTSGDRLSWICLARLWRDWRSALAIVKPEKVLAWHRAGFVLDLESAARPTWTTGHFARGPRSHPARRPHSKHPTRAGSCAIILAKSGHASLSERIV